MAVLAAVLLALTIRIDGPYFLAHLLVPRTMNAWLYRLCQFATIFQVPLAMAIVWSLYQGRRALDNIMILSAAAALLLAAAFAGGDGVDANIFFDSIFTLIVLAALLFAQLVPVVAGLKRRGLLFTALLAAPSLGILIEAPDTLRNEWHEARSLQSRSHEFDADVALLRTRPGPALCEDLRVCFEAGKPFVYDAYFTKAQVKTRRLREADLIALVKNASFSTVQLTVDSQESLGPRERDRFTAGFMEALLARYRIATQGNFSVLMVPK
jgi:hypothetical protein